MNDREILGHLLRITKCQRMKCEICEGWLMTIILDLEERIKNASVPKEDNATDGL